MNIISNIFQKINVYFIHDEDEQAPISDYLLFYGINFICLLLIVASIAGIRTF